jgi:hypothetical protein
MQAGLSADACRPTGITRLHKLLPMQEPANIYLTNHYLLPGFAGSKVQAGGHLPEPARPISYDPKFSTT